MSSEFPNTLDAWLDYQLHQHPKGIDMSLARARAVLDALQLGEIAPLVVTVAGTNGKGSTVSFLRYMLRSLGLKVGSFTSPHILNYRERIQLDRDYVSEPELLDAFSAIETAARAVNVTLTFFEYNTLAAFWIFAKASAAKQIDAVILEVGLGGRLDTVNLIDADAVILTTVDLDHQAYLGTTREQIGREKAGVFRSGQIAVYADRDPVSTVLDTAFSSGTVLLRPFRDYLVSELDAGHFRYQYKNTPELSLKRPTLMAACQIDNAAACLTLLLALQDNRRLPVPPFTAQSLQDAIVRTQIHGRMSLVGEQPTLYFDVAHNPQAAATLADWLYRHPILGRTRVVFGALEDKDALGVASALQKHVHSWYLCGLDGETERGLSAMELSARVRGATQRFGASCQSYDNPMLALSAAIEEAKSDDRVILLGSFFAIAAGFRALGFNELPFLE
jgi:dihydrofolate synthase / folylpolyglutamate synthase